MKGLLVFPVLFILLFGTPATADFQQGLDAADSGDYATALREWKPLAEQGYDRAQYLLGFMYRKGQGITQDYKAALKWYRLAAEQGYDRAQYGLGFMYFNGQGVIQDYTLAHMWWDIAASQGYEGAPKNRDIVAKKMTPPQIEKAQQLASECVAKNYKDC